MTTNKTTEEKVPTEGLWTPPPPPTSIQRVVHDGYVTLSREIKLPHNNKEYTSNFIGITVSRPTAEEALGELETLEKIMYPKLGLAPTDTKELEELRARVEKANTFISAMKSHDIIGTIFTKELQSFNQSK